MDISLLSDFTASLNPFTGCFFLAGLALGYILRGAVANPKVKRQGRYQKTAGKSRSELHGELAHDAQPYLNWADSAVKAVTSRQNNS